MQSLYLFIILFIDSQYPKQQGVFAHAADVRNGNTLLLVGGYHGNVNADLLAYTLPPMLVPGDGDQMEPEQFCSRHKSLFECAANPECGWCSADEVIFIIQRNNLNYSI
jgi:hypothetical protein